MRWLSPPVFVSAPIRWQEQATLWAMVEAGPITLAPLNEPDVPRLRELMRKYRDQAMALADAALVHVAERDGYRRIFSLDRTDFEVYRVAGRERFTILPAPAAVAGPRRRSPR